MRIIDADAFKESLKIGLKEFLPRYKKDQTRILAVEITRGLMKDIDEAKTVASCKTCVWRADHVLKVSGRENSLCPIEQHYVLPEDGFCHLYESDKRKSGELIQGTFASVENGANGSGYISHFATCPNADQHRKRTGMIEHARRN